MTPTSAGRHCASCEKEVMDFTRMTDGEVAAWFGERMGQRVCGRLRVDQVGRVLLPAARPVQGWWRWAVATLALVGLRERVAAQQSASPATQLHQRNAAIEVVDAQTDQPIVGARIVIREGPHRLRNLLTDSAGRVWKSTPHWWKVDVIHPDYFTTQGRAVGPFQPSLAGGVIRRIALQSTTADVAVVRTPVIEYVVTGSVNTIDNAFIMKAPVPLPKRVLRGVGGFFRNAFRRRSEGR